MSPQAHQSQPPQPEPLDIAKKPTLRVFLLRQVTIETPGFGKAWRNQIIGEAELKPVPPLLSMCFSSRIAEPLEDHLDWEGKLKIDERFTVGGWHAGDVRVKVSEHFLCVFYFTSWAGPPPPRPPSDHLLHFSVFCAVGFTFGVLSDVYRTLGPSDLQGPPFSLGPWIDRCFSGSLPNNKLRC